MISKCFLPNGCLVKSWHDPLTVCSAIERVECCCSSRIGCVSTKATGDTGLLSDAQSPESRSMEPDAYSKYCVPVPRLLQDHVSEAFTAFSIIHKAPSRAGRAGMKSQGPGPPTTSASTKNCERRLPWGFQKYSPFQNQQIANCSGI